MTLFLASARNSVEAGIALAAGADIVDLKEPDAGALGAVDRATITEVVRRTARRAPVSATAGDLPMHPETLFEAVVATADCGADFVKFGLFPGADAQVCLQALRPLAREVRLIVVLFADRLPRFDAVAAAARMGAYGVMLDTAGKGDGSLLDHLSYGAIGNLVGHAKAQGLSAGLAGSLAGKHVPVLLELGPDLLGFRGALCRCAARSATLDPHACRQIRALIPRKKSAPPAQDNRTWHSLPAEALC